METDARVVTDIKYRKNRLENLQNIILCFVSENDKGHFDLTGITPDKTGMMHGIVLCCLTSPDPVCMYGVL